MRTDSQQQRPLGCDRCRGMIEAGPRTGRAFSRSRSRVPAAENLRAVRFNAESDENQTRIVDTESSCAAAALVRKASRRGSGEDRLIRLPPSGTTA
jgi:hypothetical protein